MKAAMIEALVRCSAFGLLGPLFGLVALIAFGLVSPDFTPDSFVGLLLSSYLFGLLPALLTAAFDSWAGRSGVTGIAKYLLTSVCGYAAAAMSFGLFTAFLVFDPRWGLVGAIPAAICSWITDRFSSSVRESRRL